MEVGFENTLINSPGIFQSLLVSDETSVFSSSIISSVVVSGDPDAEDYFTRAEALGGSFDLTSIDAAYTETYVKGAITDYVVGLKADGLWDKLTELYLLSGVTFGGLMAKLKHAGTATLVNNNFVTGDYVAAGTGAGLKGNGSNKSLLTGIAANAWSSFDKSLSAYATEKEAAGTKLLIGAIRDGSTATFVGRASGGSAEQCEFAGGSDTRPSFEVSPRNGYLLGVSQSASLRKLFRNGSSIATNSEPAEDNAGSEIIAVFGDSNLISAARLSFSHIGTGLTDTDATNLSTRTNALMTALGTNVY